VKKMFICCGLLCMTLLLFCGSAFAAVTVTKSDDTVDVTVNDAGTEITVNKKSGVDAENLYLVMVQEGTALPTSENLYYLNVEKQNAAFEMKAYPKDGFAAAGKTYTVYLSDWSETGKGARKAVATLAVGGTGTGTGGDDKPINTDVLYGDVNGDGNLTSWDATVLACHLAGQNEFKNINEKNADCDGNGTITSWDLTVLYCHFAGQNEFANLPYKPSAGN